MTITSGRLLIFWNAYNDLDSDTKTQINGPYLSNEFGRAAPYVWQAEYAELWTIDTTGQPAGWPSGLEARPPHGEEIQAATVEQLQDRLARYTAMADEQYDTVISRGF